MTQQKIDSKKLLRHLYSASAKEVVQVEVPAMRFLMIDGEGDPNTSPQYAQAVEALFSVAYTAKFMLRKGPLATDYAVMPLEGLWWADDMSVFTTGDKSQWQWTLMIMQPDFVPDDVIDAALDEVKRKKGPGAVDQLRVEHFTEGLSAQVLHVGPFSEEGSTVARLHQFIDGKYGRRGKHHEIYLTDIRRTAPAKCKTLIRQPMIGVDLSD